MISSLNRYVSNPLFWQVSILAVQNMAKGVNSKKGLDALQHENRIEQTLRPVQCSTVIAEHVTLEMLKHICTELIVANSTSIKRVLNNLT